jgi:hypothetical protein
LHGLQGLHGLHAASCTPRGMAFGLTASGRLLALIAAALLGRAKQMARPKPADATPRPSTIGRTVVDFSWAKDGRGIDFSSDGFMTLAFLA